MIPMMVYWGTSEWIAEAIEEAYHKFFLLEALVVNNLLSLLQRCCKKPIVNNDMELALNISKRSNNTLAVVLV